jgi:hypothetical protein
VTTDFYFWLYCFDILASAVLAFRVIHEVFLDVFRPFHMLKDLGTIIFKWAGLVMLLVSVVVAFSSSSENDPLTHAVLTLQRSVRLVQVGLVLFLLLFSRFLGVSRRQVSFGVALGFGFYASVELVALALSSGALISIRTSDLLSMAAYGVAISVWLVYGSVRQEARHASVNPLQTQRWEDGLADLHSVPVSGLPPDSLIPMFEGMVERAFSKNSALSTESIESGRTRSAFAESQRRSSAAATASGSSQS